MSVTQGHRAREAVSVFGPEQELQGVIDELLNSGFNRADLSLVASMESVRPQPGASARRCRKIAVA